LESSTHSPFTNFLPLGHLHCLPSIFPPLHVILFLFLGLEVSFWFVLPLLLTGPSLFSLLLLEFLSSSQVDVSLLNVCPSGQVVFTSQVDVSWLKTNPSSQNFSHF
jgi:hypothetical protein